MSNIPTFSGFSTLQGLGTIFDIELVKQDLLNQINTRKGERLMDPEFGCIVWDLLFELKSPSIITEIQEDLTRIISSEPRVLLRQIQILEQEHGYLGIIDLYFVQFKTADTLTVQFNQKIAGSGETQVGN